MTRSDWCCLGFWAFVVVVCPVLYDCVLCPLFGLDTISDTTERWCGRWAVFTLAWAVGLGVLYHVTVNCWPFRGG